MAVWKHEKDQTVWASLGHQNMKYILGLLDIMSLLFFGLEITITSAIREKNPEKKSFHPLGQAIDLRTKTIPVRMIWVWEMTIKMVNGIWHVMRKPGRFDYVRECVGEENEHMHIEYDTGDPV